MTQLAERQETYVSAFEAFKRDAAFGRDGLASARQAAFDRFLAQGFPTTREEEWRYTNVAPIAAVTFDRAKVITVDPATLARYTFGEDDAITISVVNGRVAPLSRALPSGITLRTGRDVAAADALVAAPAGATVFADLNTAFFDDVILLEVAPKAIVSQPINLVFINDATSGAALVSPRVVIRVGDEASARVTESFVDLGGTYLTNAVTDVRVGANAHLDHVKLQRQNTSSFHLGQMFVHVGRSGTFRSHAVTVGARIGRNDIISVLDGDGAECTLNGLYVAGGESVVDTHTTIDHAQPHCPSHEVYKGILAGRARAVFNGKIVVRPDAQKTDAKQTNKALLLTNDAQVNTKPQLEIFADDVKCTHGAAIGQLDEDALFYLKARGISALDARNMLIHAFAGDVLNGIQSEGLRQTAMTLVEEMLGLPA